MRKLKTFLQPFSLRRKILILVSGGSVALTSLLITFLIIFYLSSVENHLPLIVRDVEVYFFAGTLAAWFVSAMTLSVSSNVELLKEREARQAAEEELTWFYFEQRLAREALEEDLKFISENNL